MGDIQVSDYYYGDESNQFSFYRIPGKTDPSYMESNQTDFIYPHPSINPPSTVPTGRWIDRSEQRREVEENIEYQASCRQFGREDMESVVELMTDVLCSAHPHGSYWRGEYFHRLGPQSLSDTGPQPFGVCIWVPAAQHQGGP